MADTTTWPDAADWPNHFRFMCGGGDIDSYIQQESETNTAPTQAEMNSFGIMVENLITATTISGTRLGLGFGELALTHHTCDATGGWASTSQYESGGTYYQRTGILEYQRTLINKAAQFYSPPLPLDVHMEWIPSAVVTNCPGDDPNTTTVVEYEGSPTVVFPNRPHLESLLTFAQNVSGGPVNIVWDHIGRDTSEYTSYGVANPNPSLLRTMLRDHPNLRLQVIYSPTKNVMTDDNGTPLNYSDDTLKPAWGQLFQDYPNRIVLGTDAMFDDDSANSYPAFTNTWEDTELDPPGASTFLGQVPQAYLECYQRLNAQYIYNISTTEPTQCNAPTGSASLNNTASVDLGQMATGASLQRSRTITASNSGTPLPRSVEDVTVTGDFFYSGCSLDVTHTCDPLILPGATCGVNIYVDYTDRNTCPLEVFSTTITVEYYDGATYQSLSIPVTGEFL